MLLRLWIWLPWSLCISDWSQVRGLVRSWRLLTVIRSWTRRFCHQYYTIVLLRWIENGWAVDFWIQIFCKDSAIMTSLCTQCCIKWSGTLLWWPLKVVNMLELSLLVLSDPKYRIPFVANWIAQTVWRKHNIPALLLHLIDILIFHSPQSKWTVRLFFWKFSSVWSRRQA